MKTKLSNREEKKHVSYSINFEPVTLKSVFVVKKTKRASNWKPDRETMTIKVGDTIMVTESRMKSGHNSFKIKTICFDGGGLYFGMCNPTTGEYYGNSGYVVISKIKLIKSNAK